MTNRIFGYSLATLVLLSSQRAWGIKDPETGVTFPDSSTCGAKPAKAAGVGVREATFGVDVYAVVVYASPEGFGKSLRASADACVKIVARFVREVDAEKVRGAWLEGLGKQGLTPQDASVKRLLGAVRGPMKKSGQLVLEVQKEQVTFQYLSRRVSITSAPRLARAVKGIYLGPSSPTPSLVEDLRRRGIAKP